MVSENFNLSEIRQALDLARNEIIHRKPDQALEIIGSIRDDIEQSGIASLIAEHRVLLAEALGAKGDPTAEELFSEALDLIAHLPHPQADLEMRANEHFADYLIKFAARPLEARKYILVANQVAIREGLESESIRLGMKTVLTF